MRIQNDLVQRVLGALGMVIGLILLVSLLRFGLAVYLYSAIARWATSQLGLDYYAAEFMGVALSAVIMFFIPGLGSLFFSRKTQIVNAGLIIGGYLLVCVLVYTVGRDTYFNQSTGEPLRYYAETPDGIVFSFLPGYDPKWGVERKPYTREAAQELMRKKLLAEEGKRRAELEQQKRAEEQRRAEEARLQKQQEKERQRQETEAQRQNELEQKRLAASEAEKQRLYAAAQAEKQRQQELAEQRIANEQRLEEQRLAAEQERERRLQQQQAEAEERQRQEQVAREERENQEQTARQERQREEQAERRREESSRKKRENANRLIDFAKRKLEQATGKRLP